jgi:hypothetical protein
MNSQETIFQTPKEYTSTDSNDIERKFQPQHQQTEQNPHLAVCYDSFFRKMFFHSDRIFWPIDSIRVERITTTTTTTTITGIDQC